MKHLPSWMSRWTLQAASCWCLSNICLHCWLLWIFKMVTWNQLTKISYLIFFKHMLLSLFFFLFFFFFLPFPPLMSLFLMKGFAKWESKMLLRVPQSCVWAEENDLIKSAESWQGDLDRVLKANRYQHESDFRHGVRLPMLSRKVPSAWWMIVSLTKLRLTELIETSTRHFL